MPHVSVKMRSDMFLRLPAPTALLLLSSIFELTQAYALPTQTSTVAFRVLDVVSWPILPTPPPTLPGDLRRRVADTVCGFIGGDPNLPATCLAGSHCVLDAEHGAIGCCPNGGACTAGVFTGCVDFNSGPQTVANPYVFTCQGSDVCYKNMFAGGYSQFGCGTASDLATTVVASATGLTSDVVAITSQSVTFTAPPTTLSTPTTINPSTGTRSFTASTTGSTTNTRSTTSTSSRTSSSSSHSSTTTHSSSSTKDVLPTGTGTTGNNDAGQSQGSGSDKTGAIIGGAISGAAVFIALVALAFFLWRRKRMNARNGPGAAGGTAYVSPMSGHDFKPLHSNPEGYESGLAPGMTTSITAGAPGLQQTTSTYHYPGQNPAAYAAIPAGAAGMGAGAAAMGAAGQQYRGVHYNNHMETDQVPLNGGAAAPRGEFDDFSRGFHDALERIGEEDHDVDSDHDAQGSGDLGDRSRGSSSRGGQSTGVFSGSGHLSDGQAAAEASGEPIRPLWQQNRRQSRNLMWM